LGSWETKPFLLCPQTEGPHSHVNHFSFDILMTWSPECDTHTYLFVGCNVRLSILSTSFLLIILSTHFPPNSCQHCSSHNFLGEWDFYLWCFGVSMRGQWRKEDEDEDRRCKKEASRLKICWVVGMGWQYWTTFMFVIQRSSSWVLAMATVHSKLARKSLVLMKALCRHGEAADATLVPSCGFLLGIKKAGLACLPPMSTNRM